MPVTQARLPGFQSAKSARWYQALIGPIQATGSAGGFDLIYCFFFLFSCVHSVALLRLSLYLPNGLSGS